MPLKLNIAMSRKVGERNYGSRGATVGLEIEIDSSLVDQPRELHRRIARLFRLAKASVDRELAAQMNASKRAAAGAPQPRRATANQVRAIHAIAQRQELDLGEEVKTRFGVCRPDDLSLEQASQLIDVIKPSTNGANIEP
jgi:hypothetical protein